MFKQFDKKIVSNTFRMAWPSVVESFFVALAGIIDSYMVSNLGSAAVASVGLTTQPKFIALAMFIAMNIANSALVARRRGEQNKKSANEILLTSLVMIVLLSGVISALMVSIADPVVRLCGSQPETHDGAVTYYNIIIGGMIFNTIQMGINSAQRGAGNTKITMRTNLVSSAVNILFNYLLIEGHLGFPRLELYGAALATVLGTVVASIMSILSLFKKDNFVSIPYMIKEKLKPTWTAFKSIIRVGYSVFIEQIFLRVGFFATALMAARMGTAPLAAHQVGMNILSLSFAFGDGFQAAAVALIGRSLGEKKPDLAKTYGSCCRMFGLLVSVVLVILFVFFGRQIYRLFFDEEEIIQYGIRISYVIAAVTVFQIQALINGGALRGAGDTLFTAIAGIITVTFIRTIVSWFFGIYLNMGIIGVWFGVFSDMFVRMILMTIRYMSGKWVKIKI